MKSRVLLPAVAATILTTLFSANVEANGLPWKDHRAPFNFRFGNSIDTHQQTHRMPNGDLRGYLYISFTGEYTPDGYPVAIHVNCSNQPDRCSAGWKWTGILGKATFVFHESGDHPLWLVDTREDIPQPGAYSHFHWLGDPPSAINLIEGVTYDGYFLELRAMDTFVFRHGGDEILVTPGLDSSTHLNLISTSP